MHSTQLACPHCGSTLSFGTPIATGTTVECLICMRTFVAVNPVAIPIAAGAPPLGIAVPPAKSAPPKSVPKAAPAIPKSNQPTRLPAESTSAGSSALIVVTIGLLAVLTGGIAYGVWRATTLARTGGGDPNEAQIVDNGKKQLPKDPDDKKGAVPADKNPPNGGGAPLAKADDDDDDLRAKFQEEVKQVLKRRIPSKPVGVETEPEPEPIKPIVAPKLNVAGLTQKKIDDAIQKGVAYLKTTQLANGTWHGGPPVGYASLGGLTLLECNIPGDDPVIQRAADYVRSKCAGVVTNYEQSAAILFLDRLGDPRDRPLIQGMALRLLAAQRDCGGWSYEVVPLAPGDLLQLYHFLQPDRKPMKPLPANPARNPAEASDPFQQFNELLEAAARDGDGPTKAQVPIRPEMLNPSLRNLPLVQFKGKAKGNVLKVFRAGEGDNSNTQFALLALWAARRHGIPTDQAILAAYERFVTSQRVDNGWGYQGGSPESSNTMTCVGLLGLAMGHGTAPDIIGVNPKNPKDILIKPALQDLSIQKGFQALARNIGQPSLDPDKTTFPTENFYFLWSVERVAMLYDLKTIGGKDWYGWCAQTLVHNQNPEGDFASAEFPGSRPALNTCFALLILRRSNLVPDLTNSLRLQSGIRDPEK